MTSRIATVARYTALEALRTRLPVLTLTVVGLLLGASFFVREVAITESVRFQTAFYAATIRFATVFLAALYVIASMSREFQDKGLDVVLALDLPRGEYLLGKLFGFLAIGMGLATAVGIPLVLLAGWEAGLQWVISLSVEVAVVIALALFCVVTFSQLLPAASFVIAFYLLARAINAIRLISAHPVAGADSPSQQVLMWLVEAVAFVVPGIDLWTRTAWLVEQPAPWSAIAAILAHGSIFAAVLAGAALFDFYRKNF